MYVAALGVFSILVGMGVAVIPRSDYSLASLEVKGGTQGAIVPAGNDDILFEIPDMPTGITDDEIDTMLNIPVTTGSVPTPPSTYTAPAPTTTTIPSSTGNIPATGTSMPPQSSTAGASGQAESVKATTPTANPTMVIPPTSAGNVTTNQIQAAKEQASTKQTIQTTGTAQSARTQPASAKRPVENTSAAKQSTQNATEDTAEISVEDKQRIERQAQLRAEHQKRFEQNQISTYGTTDATVAEKQKQKSQLTELGSTLHVLNTEVSQVSDKVLDSLTKDVDEALTQISFTEYTGVQIENPEVQPFDSDARQQKIETLKAQLEVRKDAIRTTVKNGIENRVMEEDSLAALQLVLQSSIDEIELLIQNETGVSVDLSTGSREITNIIEQGNARIVEEREKLKTRDGLNLYKDTDSDGVSDYDESNIYFTDPWNAHTSGSSLTDGERILLGFDPLTDDAVLIPVESPRDVAESTDNLFEVTAITLERVLADNDEFATSTPDSDMATSSDSVDDFISTTTHTEVLSFSGKGLPNSFVTLYIFSTPIVVTVKADNEGVWHYSLDVALENGEHELYVASVNSAGRIIAKSPAVPFVKTAEAVEFAPLLRPEIVPTDPLSIIKQNLLAVGVLLLVLFGFVVVLFMGMYRMISMKRHQERDIA